MKLTSISLANKAKPKLSWFAIASFIMAIIGISFQIVLINICDHTNWFRNIKHDIVTSLIVVTIFFIIIDNIGIVFGFIGITKSISHKWIAVAGVIGNGFALHLFLAILSIASI